ncbi:hypothetical protein ACFX13_006144 [Malus domestica]
MINLFFANGNFVNNSRGVGRGTLHLSAEQLEHLAQPLNAAGPVQHHQQHSHPQQLAQPFAPVWPSFCSILLSPFASRPTAVSGLLGPPWCYNCKGVSKLRTKCAIVRTAI